jgi:hypothetical protein
VSNWQSGGILGLYGGMTATGGGGNVSSRDALDFARQGSPGQTPEAQYPDGYLGAANGRREGKLQRGNGDPNTKPYSRGVHRGERIDPGDYVWPSDQQPDRGLQFQAVGMKTPLVSPSYLMNAPLVAGGADLPQPQTPSIPDPHRSGQLSGMLPPWR